MGRGLAVLAAAGIAGCGAPRSAAEGPAAWRLVEFERPGGRELVLEADEPADGPVEIRFSRRRAGVGEVVEARIRFPGASGRRRIEVRPGRPGVRVLGPAELEVEGDQPAVVRFTSDRPGLGGIEVVVKEEAR